jgi:hypothetical protein
MVSLFLFIVGYYEVIGAICQSQCSNIFFIISICFFEENISINHGHDVCPPEAQAGCVHVIPCPFQFFKMIFTTFVVCACLGITGLINIKIMCCWLDHGETDNYEAGVDLQDMEFVQFYSTAMGKRDSHLFLYKRIPGQDGVCLKNTIDRFHHLAKQNR